MNEEMNKPTQDGRVNPNYVPLNFALLQQIEQAFYADFDKDLKDLSEEFSVRYPALRNIAAANGWHERRRNLRSLYMQKLRERQEAGLHDETNLSIGKAIVKELLTLIQHEEMLGLLKAATNAHLTPSINEENGTIVPPPVDTVQKLGPILVKTIEHELKVLGYDATGKDNRASDSGNSGDSETIKSEVRSVLGKLNFDSSD